MGCGIPWGVRTWVVGLCTLCKNVGCGMWDVGWICMRTTDGPCAYPLDLM